jgi:hypothetical protein
MRPNSANGRGGLALAAAAMMAVAGLRAGGQNAAQGAADALNETGRIVVSGRSTPYLIRRLPVNSFPQLPAPVQTELNRRGCLIPQTYEAHAPENVIEASLERPGSKDWAVLCSAGGTVSLLAFFADGAQPYVLAAVPETERLQAHGPAGMLGFDWGIDVATPGRVHEAQMGMKNRPAMDHDAVAESVIDQWTVYYYFDGKNWRPLETRD